MNMVLLQILNKILYLIELNEEVIKTISNKKNEPKWLLDWRLKAYNRWKKMKEPNWAELNIPKIDYDSISYFSSPKKEI